MDTMPKRVLILLPVLAVFITGCSFSKKLTAPLVPAALQITTTPKAQVYLDGHLAGSTPLTKRDIANGEHRLTIKTPTASWISTITTKSATMTVVNRLFDTNGTSSGEQFTLASGKGLIIIGQPQGAAISIDGKEVGVSPLALPDLTPGLYELKVTAPGFAERILKVKISDGFVVLAAIDLPPTDSQMVTPSLSPSTTITPSKTTVASPTIKPTPQSDQKSTTVGQTPNGFLRVRETPSTNSAEIGRVNTGDSLTILEEQNSWLKVTTATGLSGWVSSQYVTR